MRGICQILEAADKPSAQQPAAQPAPASQPPASAAVGPPQEDWGKLMQALQANLTGLHHPTPHLSLLLLGGGWPGWVNQRG